MAGEGRKSLILRAASASAFAAGLVALTVSCAGAPVPRAAPDSIFAGLGDGAAVYAVCVVSDVRPILEAALPKIRGDRKSDDLLRRTRTAAVALFGETGPKFRLVAYGDYPRLLTSLSLTMKKAWKRVGGADPHWRSDSGLRLAFLDDGVVFLSDAPPRKEAESGPPIPPSFELLGSDSTVRAFIPDPPAFASRALGPAGELIRLPVSELVLSLKRQGDAYTMTIIATAPGEREARALAALLRFARGALKSDDPDPRRRLMGKMLGSDLSIDGARIVVSAEGLGAPELASLLPDANGALLYP